MPIPRAKLLSQSWVARYFEEGVVKGKFWDYSAHLDQTMLKDMILKRHEPASRLSHTYRWQPSTRKYERSQTLQRGPDEVVYRVSAQRGQSHCAKSPCGWLAPDVAVRHYWADAQGRPVSEQQGGGEEGRGHKLVCVMPRKSAERMVSFHQNCLSGGWVAVGWCRGFS